MEFDLVDWTLRLSMEFDIAGLGIHNTGVERLSMEFDIADGSSYSWSMEFDIVELWKRLRSDYVTCRWSSTLLTDMEMGELPWTGVERSSSEQDFVQLVDGV